MSLQADPVEEALDEPLLARARARDLVLFLDYDGTLVPICDRPEDAVLDDRTRDVVRRLAQHVPVVVVSGRDRTDVTELVALEEVLFFGSHGLDMGDETPATHAVPALRQAQQILQQRLADVRGALVEPKRFTVAVHYRLVDPADVPRVEEAVREALDQAEGLRRGEGKKVIELRPDIPWDKGQAILRFLETCKGRFPVYLGDDVTDEDAFRAIQSRGCGILVASAPRATSARRRLQDPDAVRRFLEALADAMDEGPAQAS